LQKRIGDFERRKEKILFPQAGLNKIFLLPSLPLHPIIPRPSKKRGQPRRLLVQSKTPQKSFFPFRRKKCWARAKSKIVKKVFLRGRPP